MNGKNWEEEGGWEYCSVCIQLVGKMEVGSLTQREGTRLRGRGERKGGGGRGVRECCTVYKTHGDLLVEWGSLAHQKLTTCVSPRRQK